MMRCTDRKRLWITTLLALTIGCNRQQSNAELAVASDLVMRFIAADTLQQFDLIAHDVDWSDCEWVRSSDFVNPIGAVRVIDWTQSGNQVETRVEYVILGMALAGEDVAGFERGVAYDTVTIPVLVDEDGSGTLQCGDYNYRHPGQTAFHRDWIPYLDSTSRAEWEAALLEVQR